MTYAIVRHFQRADMSSEVVERGLTLEQAQAHCNDPETSSKTGKSNTALAITRQCGEWFDGYTEE